MRLRRGDTPQLQAAVLEKALPMYGACLPASIVV